MDIGQKSNQKIKVCFLILDIPSNRPGPSDIVWDMSKEMLARGHEVHIIAPEGIHSRIEGNVHLHYFHVPPLGFRWFIGLLWAALNLSIAARNVDADIVHAPEYLSTAVFSLIDKRHPIVLTVPGNIFQRLSMPEGNQASFFYTQTIKWAALVSAKKCSKIIAFTREMKYWWERTGSLPEDTPVIPYGVDTNNFFPVPEARQSLGISSDSLMFLYVGRLDREKGIFDALNAFQKLHDILKNHKVRFDIVGSGNLKESIEAAIYKQNLQEFIYLHGSASRTDLRRWYSAADALILPSWVEPFGRVILEAMACSTPILATSTGGPVDLVKDGENGFLFPARDPNALAQKLRSVIEQPSILTEMRARSLRYIHEGLTWEKIMDRIINEVYLPILNKRNGVNMNQNK